MGCRSDYMAPNAREIESKNVINLMNEVGLYSSDIPYYGQTDKLDNHTRSLCEFCQVNDVACYSLELQIWWRDHKAADEKRIKAEVKVEKTKKDKDILISKLTDYEKELLGI